MRFWILFFNALLRPVLQFAGMLRKPLEILREIEVDN